MKIKDVFNLTRHEDKVLVAEARVACLLMFVLFWCLGLSGPSPSRFKDGWHRDDGRMAFIQRREPCALNERTLIIKPERTLRHRRG